MGTQTMSLSTFMSGEYKDSKKEVDIRKIVGRLGTSIAIPFIITKPASAASVEAIPVGETQYIGEKTLETIAHALDPLIDLMVALSFPICSVIIVGSCFFFMLGKSERAWSGIQNAGLGYVLMQIMPLLLKVLKEIGSVI